MANCSGIWVLNAFPIRPIHVDAVPKLKLHLNRINFITHYSTLVFHYFISYIILFYFTPCCHPLSILGDGNVRLLSRVT
jgi:hypothetical protein